MNKEELERMDQFVGEIDRNSVLSSGRRITRDLVEEGFEPQDVEKYLAFKLKTVIVEVQNEMRRQNRKIKWFLVSTVKNPIALVEADSVLAAEMTVVNHTIYTELDAQSFVTKEWEFPVIFQNE